MNKCNNANADTEATLDRFCHLCVMVLRENENRNHISVSYNVVMNTVQDGNPLITQLEELAGMAQALQPDNPDIAQFLLCVARHTQVIDLDNSLLMEKGCLQYKRFINTIPFLHP